MSGHRKWEDIKKRHTCRECHAEATYIELVERPSVLILRDGTKKTSTETVAAYYCDLHTGMT